MLSIYRDDKGRTYQTEHHGGGFAIVVYDYYGDRIRREHIAGSRNHVQNVLDNRADQREWRWVGCQEKMA